MNILERVERGERGVIDVGGVEVRYTPARQLMVKKGLRYLDVFGLMDTVSRLSFDPDAQRWDPVNILFSGPKGTGKSLLLAFFAETNDIPYLSLDCSVETKERHLRGGFVAKAGSTPFILGTVANAVQVANDHGSAMLVLEEITALSPQMQKELNALTDFRKKVEMPELSWRIELQPHAKLFVAGTMNPSVYGGTYELNEDLKSRFFEVEVPYPPAVQELEILKAHLSHNGTISDEQLKKLIQIANETRKEVSHYALSPRDLVDIVKAVRRVGWEDALFLAGQKFSGEDRKLIIDRIQDATEITIPATLAEYAAAKKRIL